jgi:hypothetical protein
MKSIEERLIESDPSPAGSYAPADYSAMMTRVVATPLAKPAAGLRGFKLRMAGSLVAASLLTVLGIAAIDTVGSSLPVLGFAAASSHPTTGKDATAQTPAALTPTSANMTMIPAVNYEFNGASNFSSRAGTAAVYTMVAPSDALTSLAHAASVLNVDVGTPVSHDNGQSYSSSGPQYSGLLILNTGYAWWQISDNSPPTASTAPGPSVSSLEARAFSLAEHMGSLDLGVATVLPVPGPLGGPTTVIVPIVVGAEPTELGYDFTFASDGTLVSATGEDFTLQPSASYPTVSPAAGVGEITSQLGLASITPGWVRAGSASGATGSASSGAAVAPPLNGSGATNTLPSNAAGSSTGSPSATGTSPTTVTTVSPTVIDLTGVSTKYGFFTMSDSTQMVLPLYVYSGTVVGVSSYEVTFEVVAVDPKYLDLASAQNLRN